MVMTGSNKKEHVDKKARRQWCRKEYGNKWFEVDSELKKMRLRQAARALSGSGAGRKFDKGKPKPNASSKRTCKCGSHTHSRTNHSSCPLNSKNKNKEKKVPPKGPKPNRETPDHFNEKTFVSRADLLKVLGLPPSASLVQAKKAFFRLAKSHHPDKGGNKETFMLINNAYMRLVES